MALSNEQRLISKALTEKTLQPLLDRGVTKFWFYNKQQRDVLEFVLDYNAKYGGVPSITAVKQNFGKDYEVVKVTDSFDFLLDQLATHNQWVHSRATVEDVADRLNDGDTVDAVQVLTEGLAKIRGFDPVASHMVDSMHNDRLNERWDNYLSRSSTKGLLGLSTGFSTIDKTTLGLQPGQLITVLAQHKVGKTSLCLAMANHIYVEHEAPILFSSFEMGISELEMRQESMMAGISFRRLQQGALTPIEEKRYDDWLSLAESDYTWPFHFMDVSSGATVSSVQAKVERLDPAVVFVDGIYMMRDEVTGDVNSWEAITNITRSLKRLAVQTERPIVINSQALASKSKGKRISSDSAGYSSSFGQDSDVVLGLERIQPGKGEEDSLYEKERILKILASRNSGLGEVDLIFDYSEGRIQEVGT